MEIKFELVCARNSDQVLIIHNSNHPYLLCVREYGRIFFGIHIYAMLL